MDNTADEPGATPDAPARILNAAIGEFAANGFARTTIRTIAASADVSPGLVIHHYGSKTNLRIACDEYVFEELTARKTSALEKTPLSSLAMFDDPATLTLAEYMLKSLLDPSPEGRRYFEHFVDTNEEVLANGFAGHTFRRAEDTRGQAAALAVLGLAPLLLAQRVREVLGTKDVHETMLRLAPHLAEIYQVGLIEHVPGTTEPSTFAPQGEENS